MLVARGRLTLAIDTRVWIATIIYLSTIRFIPIDPDIAIESVELPTPLHKDPADRIIIATARRLNIPIITADEKIQAYPHARTIW